MTSIISDDRHGDVSVLTLRRPESLNALSEEMINAIETALDRHESCDAKAIIFTGEGRAFCAGADLKEPLEDTEARVRRMHALAVRLIEYPKLSVAAINGLALGGGLELAMASTLRVAAPKIKLGLPEVKLSVMPCYGGTQLLPRIVGEAKALEMMLTGEPITSEEACRIGLVNLVAEDVVSTAIALAQRCTAHGQAAQLAIRRAVRQGADLDLRNALRLEHDLGVSLSKSPEALAALQAFSEKSKTTG